MAYQVVWSPEALEDVEAIASYIARDSASYAAAVVNKILDTTRNLCNVSFATAIVPEFGEKIIVEQSAYSYRIIYRIEGETITIASVIHGKSLVE